MKKNEIKFWVGVVLNCVILLAVSLGNNVILLSRHPLEYYYTLPGMGLSMAVAVIEIPVVVAAMKIIHRFFIKPYSENMKETREMIDKIKGF